MTTDFDFYEQGGDSTSRKWAAITPHDTNELDPIPRAVYVGVSGDLYGIGADDAGDTAIAFQNVPAGRTLEIQPRIIHTDTTASGLVALY